ncbi:MAG: 30S ribosomal protein S8 [Caldisericaceae bacterium]
MVNDPVADLLIRLKNASDAKHKSLTVPSSKMVVSVLKVLKKEGFLKDFEEIEIEGKKYVKIHMRYGSSKEGYILGVKRISKPGRRVYVNRDQLPKVLDGFGTAIISTSKGIMSDKEARTIGLGGEVLCFVW